MNTPCFVRISLIALTALVFSACGKSLGPVPVELKTSQKFELRAASGKTLELDAGSTIAATASYDARKRLVLLQWDGETVPFSGAKFQRKTGDVVASAARTGQGVGLKVSSREAWMTREPLRQERRPCTIAPAGRSWCSSTDRPQWCHGASPHFGQLGWQLVEVARVRRGYNVTAILQDRSNTPLAQAFGQYQEQAESIRPLEECW
jgi:hypothetical protein